MTSAVESLVSTIIPVYNRTAMLREAVASALAQTYRPIEVIIVDDGSTDDTPQVAESLARQHSGLIQLIRQTNQGPGPARNLGLTVARGEFVQYLDSDDLIAPTKFEHQVAALRECPDRGVAYCLTLRPDESGTKVAWARTGERFERILPEFLIGRGWATLTPLWRRTVCDAIGPWAPFRVMEDWEHDCRAGILGVRPVWCPDPLARVRDHGGYRAGDMGIGWSADLVRYYFAAHRSVCQRLWAAGLTNREYMGPFSRKLFWLARTCAAHDLRAEAREALRFAVQAAQPGGSVLEMRGFRALAGVLGWRRAANVCEGIRDCLRRKK
jgi:glycosyltransferase involved in cell wall biosynthesis